jgi:hypothetical protein
MTAQRPKAGSGELAPLEIGKIFGRLKTAVWQMQHLRSAAGDAFEKSAALSANVVAAVDAALNDEPAPARHDGTPESDLVSVELKRDQAELVLEATKDMHVNAAQHFPAMLAEMCLVTLFARYDAFISDLLICLYRARPDFLRSGKQITYESVLGANSLDQLRDELIHREIQDWRKPLRAQLEALEERFGIEILSEASVDPLVEASEKRHLFVHRGGKVDIRYLNAVPSSQLREGAKLLVDADYCESMEKVLLNLAHRIAAEISTHCLGHPMGIQPNEIKAPD